MKRIATLLVLTLVAACGGGTAATTTVPADTTTAAGAETTTTTTTPGATTGDGEEDRSLVVYSGRSEELVGPLIDRFEQESGIEVEVRYAGSGEMATTILQEGESSPADVFYSQDPAFAGAVAQAGLFQTLPDDILSMVPERFSDDQGRWVGITARSRVLVYNPELVSEEELPDDVWSLTDPAWSGRLGLAPTNASFVAFVSAMLLAEGEERTREWLEGISANDPVIFDGNSPIVAAVDAGDVDAGLVNHYYLLRLRSEQGGSTAVNHFFGSGDPGALVMPSGAGILASSRNPDEAAELLRFLLSEESQQYFLDEVFEYPLVEGAGTPEGQTPLAELPELDVDLSELATVLEEATTLIAEAGLT